MYFAGAHLSGGYSFIHFAGVHIFGRYLYFAYGVLVSNNGDTVVIVGQGWQITLGILSDSLWPPYGTTCK